jgi:hypothetical protein
MNIKIPNDLINKSEKEIREMISDVGLVPFSKILVSYLENKDNLNNLKTDLNLLEKIAISIDSVLAYYQINKMIERTSEKPPIHSDLVNKFIGLYLANSKKMYEYR